MKEPLDKKHANKGNPPVETLANTGVARSDLVADVGDLVAEDESSSMHLPETKSLRYRYK